MRKGNKIFRKIKETNFLYEISRDGECRNVKSKHVIKPDFSGNSGYGRFVFWINKKHVKMQVSRILLLTWGIIPERLKDIPLDDLQVNHIDGDKRNNSLDNLEWVTRKENCHHRNYILNKCNEIESFNKQKIAKKKIICVENNLEFESSYKAAAYLKDELKIRTTSNYAGIANSIREVARGKKKLAYNFHWKFL